MRSTQRRRALLWVSASVAVGVLSIFYLRSLARPSLWLDEAWEANYYAGFTEAPWYNRPVLYMAAVRLLVSLFGPSELALRLLPCAAGIAGVVATWFLTRRTAGPLAACLAFVLLSVVPGYIFEAHQLKHYALDALSTGLIALSWMRWRDAPDPRRLAVFLATGALSFGFSFTGIFIVAAIASIEGAGALGKIAHRRLAPGSPAYADRASSDAGPMRGALRRALHITCLPPGALFGAGCFGLALLFAGVYLGFHTRGASDPLLKEYFVDSYPPPAGPLLLLSWLGRRTAGILRATTGAGSGFLATSLVLIGAVSEIRRAVGGRGAGLSTGSDERGRAPRNHAAILSDANAPVEGGTRPALLSVLLPCTLGLNLAASVLHLYPYGVDRLSLYLAPLVAPLVAGAFASATRLGRASGRAMSGTSSRNSSPRDRYPRPLSASDAVLSLAALALFALFLAPSLRSARPYLSTGWRMEDTRGLVSTLARERDPDEAIYVSEGAYPAFVFYWRRGGGNPRDPRIILGERHRINPELHSAQIETIALSEERLWCLFSHLPPAEMATLRRLFSARYATLGTWGERDVGLDHLVRRRPL